MSNIWWCKIGEAGTLPKGADGPMRDAVSDAYKELTGKEPNFIFSGWGGKLTEAEQACIDDRKPNWIKTEFGFLEAAWGIIANAFDGDWHQASKDWKEAAIRWREEYHRVLKEMTNE